MLKGLLLFVPLYSKKILCHGSPMLVYVHFCNRNFIITIALDPPNFYAWRTPWFMPRACELQQNNLRFATEQWDEWGVYCTLSYLRVLNPIYSCKRRATLRLRLPLQRGLRGINRLQSHSWGEDEQKTLRH